MLVFNFTAPADGPEAGTSQKRRSLTAIRPRNLYRTNIFLVHFILFFTIKKFHVVVYNFSLSFFVHLIVEGIINIE